MRHFRRFKSILKYLLIRFGYHSKPHFLIAGAQKAGTTYLYSILKNHPIIIEPGWKEVHFFDNEINFRKGKNWYYSNFFLPYRFTKDQITFEATPDYFHNPVVPKRIREVLPNLKIIIILRDPVKRAFSAWNMHHYLFKTHQKHKDLYDPRSFKEAIKEEIDKKSFYNDGRDYLRYGQYIDHIKCFQSVFRDDQIMILDSEHLKENEKETLKEIHQFLGVHDCDYSKIIKSKNEFWDNKGDYKNKMPDDIVEFLKEYYEKYDKQLYDLLQRKFSWMK